MLWWTPIPRIASVIEGVWYCLQSQIEFESNFNAANAALQSHATVVPPVGAVADALRQLDGLRQEGLISEYEFEQKRRQLLDRIA